MIFFSTFSLERKGAQKFKADMIGRGPRAQPIGEIPAFS